MEVNQTCTVCKTKIDGKIYKKDRNVCKTCYNKNRNKRKNTFPPNINIVSDQQPEIENVNNKDNNTTVSTHENHAYVVIGPRNVGKTFYMLNKLKKR